MSVNGRLKFLDVMCVTCLLLDFVVRYLIGEAIHLFEQCTQFASVRTMVGFLTFLFYKNIIFWNGQVRRVVINILGQVGLVQHFGGLSLNRNRSAMHAL